MLTKNPGFALVAIVSLALGIGANTAIFSLMDKLLLRALPVAHPEQLVTVATASGDTSFSYPLYTDYRNRNDVFAGLAAYFETPFSLSDNGTTERVYGNLVSGNYFDVLGVTPAVGRFFAIEEDQTPGTHPVAVLSYSLWQRRFNADPNVINHTVLLNAAPFTIIGVAPAEFTGVVRGSSPAVYVPMMMQIEAMPTWTGALSERSMTWLEIIGRLKPDLTRQQAQASLALLAEQIKQTEPLNVDSDLILNDASRGQQYNLNDVASPLAWLMVMVGLVLLIACANVANLLIARATARRKEIAIRVAIGAGRARLVRQLLTESLLLAVAGGALGLLVARWLIDLLVSFLPSNYLVVETSLDNRVLAFTLALSVLTGIIFGLAPALQSSKPDVVGALKGEAATIGGRTRRLSLRNLLVVAQVALSLLVLVSAGLCVRSLQKLLSIDAGFEPARVLVMSLDVALNGHEEAQGRQFYSQLTERVSALPGVESASLAALVPLSGSSMSRSVKIEGHEPPDGKPPINFGYNVIDLNYFRTMGISLLRGRDFTPQDRAGAPKVIIINETIARTYWPDQDPLGKHIIFGKFNQPDEQIEIVGVVKDSKYRNLTEAPRPMMFLPFLQSYRANVALHVRSAGDPKALTMAVRREVQALDDNLPVYNIRTLEDQRAGSLYVARFAATLSGFFGGLALLLASVGIYGVMAYSVSRRTREIGIRMALGAGRRDVLRLVLGEGLLLIGVGLIVGILATLAVTRLMAGLLYGVSATDPLTLIAIPIILAGVALGACFVPARRATRVDPMVALRYE